MKTEINDALVDASRQGLLEKVNRCLSNDADPNAGLEAAVCGRPEIVKVLLSAGANPNAEIGGETILMIAISAIIIEPPTLTDADFRPGAAWKPHIAVQTEKQPEIVKLLLSASANPNAEIDGRTVLTNAVSAYYDNIEFVKLLLSAGANPNAADTIVLRLAATGRTLNRGMRGPSKKEANAEIVKLLLSAGANPNAAWNGDTVLMLAAQEGHAEIVRVLLSAGADPNVVNKTWDTALDIAKKSEYSEIVHILEEAGSKIKRAAKNAG